MKRLILLLAACSVPSAAAAQLSITYGPEDAPLGCPVHVTLNNDTEAFVIWDPCGFQIVDATGAQVFLLPCTGPVGIPPGETFVHTWPQTDNQGAQVPPGTYHLGNLTGPAIQVGNVDIAISQLGAPKTGTARSFQVCSPLDPGAPFFVAASGSSSPGIPTCAGMIPLKRDRFMRLSLTSPATFRGFRGTLDGAGLATSPTLIIPDDPSLVGTRLYLALVVRNQGTGCQYQRISAPLELVIR